MNEQDTLATISVETAGRTLHAVVTGEIDLSNRAEITTLLARAWDAAGDGVDVMELDLSRVSFMDSQGVALLHALHLDLTGQHKALRIRTGAGTAAQGILALTGMHHLLDIRDS